MVDSSFLSTRCNLSSDIYRPMVSNQWRIVSELATHAQYEKSRFQSWLQLCTPLRIRQPFSDDSCSRWNTPKRKPRISFVLFDFFRALWTLQGGESRGTGDGQSFAKDFPRLGRRTRGRIRFLSLLLRFAFIYVFYRRREILPLCRVCVHVCLRARARAYVSTCGGKCID